MDCGGRVTVVGGGLEKVEFGGDHCTSSACNHLVVIFGVGTGYGCSVKGRLNGLLPFESRWSGAAFPASSVQMTVVVWPDLKRRMARGKQEQKNAGLEWRPAIVFVITRATPRRCHEMYLAELQ